MARKTETRDHLIEAAVELIHARSYSAVGVQEICRRAGVRKGSFYHFFPSKRDLTLAALERLWQQLREGVFDPALADDIPPLDRITRFFERSAAFQQEHSARAGHVLGCPLGNLALEMSTQDAVLRARIDELFRAAERRIAAVLDEAKADGTFPGEDTEAGARAVFAYMEGVLLMAKTRDDPVSIRQLGRSAVALARNAAGTETAAV